MLAVPLYKYKGKCIYILRFYKMKVLPSTFYLCRVFSFIYIHATHYSLIPSYFRIVPCDEGIGLPCRVQARIRAISTGILDGLSLISPACQEGYEAFGVEDCCHGYKAYTELSTDKRIRWDIVLIRRQFSVCYCSRSSNSVILLFRA